MTIRAATLTDKAQVIGLLKEAHAGGGFNDPEGFTGFVFPFDPAYAERLFLVHLNNVRALCLVHDVDGLAQGVLMAAVAEDSLSPTVIAKETVWWINPSHRGRAAFEMLDAYEAWARKMGCATCTMGLKSDPRSADLYARRGYRPADVFQMKGLP
jgi:GNAT superfamily N-acetyltransferase